MEETEGTSAGGGGEGGEGAEGAEGGGDGVDNGAAVAAEAQRAEAASFQSDVEKELESDMGKNAASLAGAINMDGGEMGAIGGIPDGEDDSNPWGRGSSARTTHTTQHNTTQHNTCAHCTHRKST